MKEKVGGLSGVGGPKGMLPPPPPFKLLGGPTPMNQMLSFKSTVHESSAVFAEIMRKAPLIFFCKKNC